MRTRRGCRQEWSRCRRIQQLGRHRRRGPAGAIDEGATAEWRLKTGGKRQRHISIVLNVCTPRSLRSAARLEVREIFAIQTLPFFNSSVSAAATQQTTAPRPPQQATKRWALFIGFLSLDQAITKSR